MSILIRGMDMPKDGEMLCINIYPSGTVCINLDLKCKRVANAVPVPPHGRLIDTSSSVQTHLYDDEHEEWTDVEMTVEDYLGYCNNDVPTVIPAEEGE